MRLPNADSAILSEAKLRDYLLNSTHPDNGGKARVFLALGYARDDWQQLASDLREQHLTQEASISRANAYGTAWRIEAELRGPQGNARIRSVWFIEFGSEAAHFLTAYRMG
jgi:hypothetical protein